MPRVTFKIEKQVPTMTANNGSSDNLELFHGIGNTLGFNITGGCDFSMPITIFHVSLFFAFCAIDDVDLVHVLFAKRLRAAAAAESGRKKEKVIRNVMVANRRRAEDEIEV